MVHLLDLFKPKRQEKPEDQRQFEEAQARLHATTRTIDHDRDVLGALVRQLKGAKPRKERATP